MKKPKHAGHAGHATFTAAPAKAAPPPAAPCPNCNAYVVGEAVRGGSIHYCQRCGHDWREPKGTAQ